MTESTYFDIVIQKRRAAGTDWHRLGRGWFHAGRGDKSDNVSLEFNSLPLVDESVRLVAPLGQEPVDCARRFRVVVPVRREADDDTYWHEIGVAVYAAPKNGDGDGFELILDSVPHSGRAMLFPVEDDA